MDAIRQRQTQVPVSFAFQGNHQLKTTVTISASQVEVQVLQGAAPFDSTLGKQARSPTSPSDGMDGADDSGSERPPDETNGSPVGAGMCLLSFGVESFEVSLCSGLVT